jgi:lysophospholipase L1-like esterase
MKNNRKVLHFAIWSVCIYLILSIAAVLFNFQWKPFKRVNLISDIFSRKTSDSTQSTPDSNKVVVEKMKGKNFELYKTPRLITGFDTDPSKAALNNFLQKLYELKNGKKKKIRIAYFGDSIIEGDLITQTLRKLLQQFFGGSGVGFVPITSQVSKDRQSVFCEYSGGWTDENFVSGNSNKVFLSGHLFRSGGDWVQMIDKTLIDNTSDIEKYLICGKTPGPVSIIVNNNPVTVNAPDMFNRILLGADQKGAIKLEVADKNLPVYGISFESSSGIYVDNFAFRGVSGTQLEKIDSDLLRKIAEKNSYDLIVFQYGANILNHPGDHKVDWYGKAMLPVVRKIRNCFDKADLLIISAMDIAFRYDGEYKSSIAIDSLVKTQAVVAYETGSCFYNMFASMGGTNSMVEWVKMKPPLAYKDYVHPNIKGSEVLGQYLYGDLIKEYDKYIQTRK